MKELLWMKGIAAQHVADVQDRAGGGAAGECREGRVAALAQALPR